MTPPLTAAELNRRRGFRAHLNLVAVIVLTLLLLPITLPMYLFALFWPHSYPKPRRNSAEWMRDMELARRAQEYEESK